MSRPQRLWEASSHFGGPSTAMARLKIIQLVNRPSSPTTSSPAARVPRLVNRPSELSTSKAPQRVPVSLAVHNKDLPEPARRNDPGENAGKPEGTAAPPT